MTKTPNPVLVLLAGATLAATLAGCTPTSPDPATASGTTPTADASTTPPVAGATTDDDPVALPANIGHCVDGTAVLHARGPEHVDFLEPCDAVSIVGDRVDVTLGAVGQLVVEGSLGHVTAESVDTIDFAGGHNEVVHGGPAPQVDDHGTTGNRVVAAD